MKISKFLKQDGNNIITTKPAILTLNKSEYDSQNYKENVETNQVWVKSLLAVIEYEEKIFNLTLDYAITLYTSDIIENNKKIIKLKFKSGETILEATSETGDDSVAISYVERLIGGRELLKDASHLYRKLYGIYGKASGMDSVHLEILCSQVLRDKNNINIPARLASSWNPILINMKKIVYSEGFIEGLAFENIGEALRNGLISEEREEPSILHKVLTGELAEESKK